MEERYCLECGEKLRGRADQKFCNDLCRNAFNNKKNGRTTTYMRKINRILKNNYTILKNLNVDDKTTILKSKLDRHSFNYNFYTHTYTTRNGNTYFFCYDQGYLELTNNRYLLVKREDI